MTENPFDDYPPKWVKGARETELKVWREKWEPVITEALEKAEKYDEYAKIADKDIKALNNSLRFYENKLEAVKEFILLHKEYIESDIDGYGMLKPVLEHFLKE